MHKKLVLVFLVLFIIFIIPQTDATWPMFLHDPQHTGGSPFVGVQTNKLQWRLELPFPGSQPVIGSDGTIYVPVFLPHQAWLVAVDPNGTHKWNSAELPISGFCCRYTNALATVGPQDTILLGWGFKTFHAYNTNGSIAWTFDAEQSYLGAPTVAQDGSIYFTSSGNSLYALASNGEFKWRRDVSIPPFFGRFEFSIPAVAPDGTVYALAHSSQLFVFTPEGVAKPTLSAANLYPNGPLSVTIGEDGIIYAAAPAAVLAIEPLSGLWLWRKDFPFFPFPVSTLPTIMSDGTIVVGAKGAVMTLHPVNGSLGWTFPLNADEVPMTPAIGADGTIYIGVNVPNAAKARFLAISPNGTLKWEYTLLTRVYSPPAIGSDGTVYFSASDATGLALFAFGPGPGLDTIPPAAVTDLAVTTATTDSVTLTWTAHGDDGNVGTATAYDIRYSTSPITEINWDSAMQATGEPTPNTAGSQESFVLTGLAPGTTYHLALKTSDEVPNLSELSNVAVGTTTMLNQPPIADAGHDSTVFSGDLVLFNASNSTDPDGTIIRYEWDFGDGDTATGRIVTHRFRGSQDQPRIYTVTLTVEDDEGVVDTDSIDVTVTPLEKVVIVSHQPAIPAPGQPVLAKVTVSYNWLRDDAYVVSKINYESEGFIGLGTISIWDFHSHPVPLPIWTVNIPVFGDTEKTFSPVLSETQFRGDTFRGIRVEAFDAINVIILGWAGIHFSLHGPSIPVPFFECSSVAFQPNSSQVDCQLPLSAPNLNFASLFSPGELRVHDSQGRVTGLVNGQVIEEIPNSTYFNNTIILISPSDSYTYEVAGTDNGTYGLAVVSIQDGNATNFTAIDIPIINNSIHQYAINWTVLSQGEEGVTLKIDFDGDGTFEQTVIADNDLTRDEFILQTETIIDFDPDTLNLKSKGRWVTVYIELPEGFDVSQIDVSSIMLNGTVPALTKPTEVGDHDDDGVPDLMVKFDRATVQAILSTGEQVPVTVSGKIEGIRFKGIDSVRVTK